MTPELHDRWQRGNAPFDGLTLSPSEWLPVGTLAAALVDLVRLLQVDCAVPLHALLDWHQHDGFLTGAESTSWTELEALVQTPAALVRAFADGDAWVYRAYFPADFKFLLRFYLSDEDAPVRGEWAGTLDLTGPPSLVSAAREVLAQNGDGASRTVPAQAHFRRIYAG